ncbi:hypothetical protein CHARACLAT_028785 [Characodon lateralis]|uniref:Uncharacterized protein n=1 Tax=Characodon lateralis TaxID=208331 RepID=A0ABU7EF52_9TELE|nr:hypothetical protein [Characodon lateralis]
MHGENMQTPCRKTPGQELNPGPSCCKATVLPTAPPCSPEECLLSNYFCFLLPSTGPFRKVAVFLLPFSDFEDQNASALLESHVFLSFSFSRVAKRDSPLYRITFAPP